MDLSGTTDGVPGSDDGSDRRAPGAALAQFRSRAEELTTSWWRHGLDYSPASLSRLDDLIDDEWNGKARFRDVDADPEGTHEERVFAGLSRQIGGYLGEVLVRNLDGEWRETPDVGWTVVVEGDGAAFETNVFHVAQECLWKDATLAMTYDAAAWHVGDDGIGQVDPAPKIPYRTPGESASPADFRRAAEKLASVDPDALDRSPDSLVVIDDLCREKLFDGEVDLDRLDEQRRWVVVAQIGSYFGQVFVDGANAEWEYDDERDVWSVVFGDDAGRERIDPFVMTVGALKAGERFQDLYDDVGEAVDRIGGWQETSVFAEAFLETDARADRPATSDAAADVDSQAGETSHDDEATFDLDAASLGLGETSLNLEAEPPANDEAAIDLGGPSPDHEANGIEPDESSQAHEGIESADAEDRPETIDRDSGAGEFVGTVRQDEADRRIAATMRERAGVLVDDYPDRDLDYSVASLSRLDDLVETDPADATDVTPDGEEATRRDRERVVRERILPYAGYFGEVLRQGSTDAVWIQRADGPAVAVPVDGEVVSIDVVGVATSVATEGRSFETLYAVFAETL